MGLVSSHPETRLACGACQLENTMQINVAQLLKEPVGSTRKVDFDEEISVDGAPSRLTGHFLLTRLDRSILVSGEVKAKLLQVCSRCLREFVSITPFKIEEEYFPTVDVHTGLPLEAPENEGGFTIDSNHLIDLDEALRQNLLVTLPMAPLCRPDCPGLCPQCGANLNQTECGCERAPEDSRWAEVEKLNLAEKGASERKEDPAR